MKKYTLLLLLLTTLLSCRKDAGEPDPRKQLADFLSGKFSAILVIENENTVYQRGASANLYPGYEQYRLDFSGSTESDPRVKLTEYTGETFNGKWQLEQESASEPERLLLVLTGLSPEPSESQGRMTFRVLSRANNELRLKSLRSSPKTGDTVNTYTLVPE